MELNVPSWKKMFPKERVDFLKELLEYNGFTVVVVPTPPPNPRQ